MQTYKEQQNAIEREVEKQRRENRATQLRACARHYQDMADRLIAPPIDPSGDAVTVRTDLLTFIMERIQKCHDTIDRLQ